jgi:fatty-acyl-CoA synthase
MNPGRRFPGAFRERLADKPAAIMAGSGEALTYAELDARANQGARMFAALGAEPGRHVAFCLENRLELVWLQWAAHYAGLYYTFISTRLTGEEIAYIVDDCQARVLVVSAKTAPAALAELGDGVQVLSVDAGVEGAQELAGLMEAVSDAPLPDAVEGSDMLYSSGTTGRPKGIKPELSGEPLGSTCVIADLGTAFFGMGEDSVYLSPAPYYHAAPCRWVQGFTAVGATAVIMERFDAEEALRAIERYGVSHSQWVPTMFLRMLRLPDEVRARHSLSTHRVAIHAAAPCPVEVKQAMIDWWGPILYEYYSGTEGAGMCMCDSEGWRTHPGSVGKAIFGEPHVLDDDGRELPVGEEGLIYFSGGQQFEYHGDPEKTAGVYRGDMATLGDVGRLDEDGYLYLTDRKSNMIISGGVNIYPQEAENVLLTHPKVFDVAVIGVPHPDFGEEVRAVVQLADGVDGTDAVAQELLAACRSRLSSIKCPRSVEFRDDLPREPNGKLLKRKIRDEYWAGRQSQLT